MTASSSPLLAFRPWVTASGVSPQRDFLRAAATHPVRVYRGGNQTGKGHPVDEVVLTPTGWRPCGDLRVGDVVVAGDGRWTNVVGVFPRGRLTVFRLTFDDGASVRCDEDHLWKILDREGRFPSEGREGAWRVASLREIRSRWGDNPPPVQRVAIPVVPVELCGAVLPLDPYFLGSLLGDGCLRWGNVVGSLGLMGHMSYQKFVPPQFLWASRADRLSLLQGLMDTDGTVGKDGQVSFTSVSPALADAVVFLVRSLGGKASTRTRVTSFRYKGELKRGRPSTTVRIRLPGVVPFRLERKASRCFDATSRRDHRVLHRIEPVGEADVVCIAVDHPDQTYVVKDFIVTHNSLVNVVDAALRVTGLHHAARFRCPQRGWLSALDWEMVGAVLWTRMRHWVDPASLRSVVWLRRNEPAIPSALAFRCGCEIQFKSSDAGARKYQGSTLHWIGLDEEHDQDVVEECRARLVKHGGDLWVTATPIRRKAWLRDLEREPTTVVVRASMRDAAAAGLLDLQGVERTLAALPERQRRVRELGDFAALEGLVYPTFDRATHVLRPRGDRLVDGEGRDAHPWPIPARWWRLAAIDFGYAVPTAVVVAAQVPETGELVVERCYYAAGVRASTWATVLRRVLPPLAAPLVADHDAFERAELGGAGIPTRPARKDVVPGLEAVERRLHPDPATGAPRLRLVVQDDAPPLDPVVGRCDGHWLAWELEGYRYAGDRGTGPSPRDLPLKRDDHAVDSVRYLVVAADAGVGGRLELPDLRAAPSPIEAARGAGRPW